jgi:hypothetical protein
MAASAVRQEQSLVDGLQVIADTSISDRGGTPANFNDITDIVEASEEADCTAAMEAQQDANEAAAA